jgi:hypothetical protein
MAHLSSSSLAFFKSYKCSIETKEKDNLEDATSCRKKPSILAQQDGNVIHAQL